MKKINLSTEIKDVYTISADPWGDFEIQSDNLFYAHTKTHHGAQCRNITNSDIIRAKCAIVVNLIEEIEQLNK